MAELVRRYWDTSAITQVIAEQDDWEVCAQLLEDAEIGKYQAMTLSLTIAEIAWRAPTVGERGRPRHEKRDVIERFFYNSYFRVVDLTQEIAEHAQKLMFEHGLQSNDASHLAAAIHHRCRRLYTFDNKLLDCGTVGITIVQRPKISDQQLALDTEAASSEEAP